MSNRVINFNAGPAGLPLAALERAQKEFLDFEGTGMSIMEHSHRGKDYEKVHGEAISLLTELLGIPADYQVLLMQGGASAQFALIPMNLLPKDKSADYVNTGTWAKKAFGEAKLVGKVRLACSVEESDGTCKRVPKQAELDLDPNAAYVHICSNNTIMGTQFHTFPETGAVPLFADMSSDILWKPIDVSKFGLIYAGAQKNIGPSGVTLVIAKKSLIEVPRGPAQDLPLQGAREGELAAQYRADVRYLHDAQRAPGRERAGRSRGDGEAQPRKGSADLRHDRREPRVLPWPGRTGEPLVHEPGVSSPDRAA